MLLSGLYFVYNVPWNLTFISKEWDNLLYGLRLKMINIVFNIN